ncbi:DUF2357 domain-containing protein [Bacillus sp. AK128]
MVSRPSGFRRDIELVKIDTDEISLVIKGRPYHHHYESLKQYRKINSHDIMDFIAVGPTLRSTLLYNIDTDELTNNLKVKPIFFENGVYQIIVIPKQRQLLEFYHEHKALRNAITTSDLAGIPVLMGNLEFQNEIGYSTFEIKNAGKTVLKVDLEIFPVKLDYRQDYWQLMSEVNDEIYNLAFHFIRKTYLGANIKLDGTPSLTEFYRLISRHFQQFIQAINRIEQQPHHKLNTVYVNVRGDQLRKMNSYTRKYLQKKGNFVEVQNGISIQGKTVMPKEGINIKKELLYDTLENQYVKWMIKRLTEKIEDLINTIYNLNKHWKQEPDHEIIKGLTDMNATLKRKIKNPFWYQVSRLDRSVMSIVMQMALGYRDAFKIYLTVTKGLMLQSKIYHMSVKDVATLYEYWTFLKLGQILERNYTMISQDIIKVNRSGLFVNLDTSQKAERIFEHPITKERIILSFQKHETGLPTINQKPDTMLSISKKGKNFTYNYIFDAKYRVDYAQEDGSYHSKYKTPGPVEDDINTMHRYRDSIVYKNNGPYERTAFGAYVLFPWKEIEKYKEHPLYESINQVNIGGLPFLPQATDLVEQFVKRLIEKSPEELQIEGILPRGAKEDWELSHDEKVLIGTVSTLEEYKEFIEKKFFRISSNSLKKGWQEAKYIALYVTIGVAISNGIMDYGKIEEVTSENGSTLFYVQGWENTNQVIKPVKYGIASNSMTTINQLKEAKELPELYMRSAQETNIWRMLRRISNAVSIELDDFDIDKASSIIKLSIMDFEISIMKEEKKIKIKKDQQELFVDEDLLLKRPSIVFRNVIGLFCN